MGTTADVAKELGRHGRLGDQYPIRAIHQIELSSRCNLRCTYCPSYRLARPKVDIELATFSKALRWASFFESQHHHGELNLAGIGESTLHPQFIELVRLARETMGWAVRLVFATNGLLIDDALARALAPYKLDVYVSLHRPEKAQRAVQALLSAGILAGVSCDGAVNSTDWAGQVKWPVTSSQHGERCTWYREGKVIVLADGRISRCSFDASGCGVLGTVDDDLMQLHTSSYELCKTCHLH